MILWRPMALLIVYIVRTSGASYDKELVRNSVNEFSAFSFWPSPHNAATVMRIRKREVQNPVDENAPVAIEGGTIDARTPVIQTNTTIISTNLPHETDLHPVAVAPLAPKKNTDQALTTNVTTNLPINITSSTASNNVTSQNVTMAKVAPNQMDINPGVMKRALIVFGGFSLLAVAYYVFFKRKGSKNEPNNANTSDANQFRYGVLQSEDRRDNVELSRIPLTMDSDEDDDDDLEIFDLGQKKKSLSYVNLQTNEDDVDLTLPGQSDNHQGSEGQDLLLDIEDRAGDTLINWSNNGNSKFIL